MSRTKRRIISRKVSLVEGTLESYIYTINNSTKQKITSPLFLEIEMKIALYIFVADVIHEAFGKHLLSEFLRRFLRG